MRQDSISRSQDGTVALLAVAVRRVLCQSLRSERSRRRGGLTQAVGAAFRLEERIRSERVWDSASASTAMMPSTRDGGVERVVCGAEPDAGAFNGAPQ